MYERADWPLPKLHEYFKNDTLAMIGYGSQGHGQSLNARDNGLKVIVGVREGGESWKMAQEDGWVRPTNKNCRFKLIIFLGAWRDSLPH